jgi:transcriptional regulator with XRE-family HTH domain
MPSPALLARPVLRTFSRHVRAARVKVGWSQRELARRAYMREEFVYRIERGTENPSLASMALIALALNCDVRDLLSPER